MKLGNILICLNDMDNLSALLETGCALALKHDAHLTGVFVIPAMQIYPVYEGIAMAEIFEGQHQKYEDMAADVQKQFERALEKNLITGEWRKLDSPISTIADEFIAQARMVDLVMIAQVDSGEDCGVEQDFAERVILETGRPVLLLPRQKTFGTIGERVLIGWNATREAARASFDAMALLSATARVDLVWVDPQKQRALAGNVPGAELAKTFAHHNINVNAEALPTANVNAGEALLTRAVDLNSDLLVMGAYGHSRMREFVFGGATRHVLNNMTLPVLMSC